MKKKNGIFILLLTIAGYTCFAQDSISIQRRQLLLTRAAQETSLMKARYQLADSQLTKVSKVNEGFYNGIIEGLSQQKDSREGKEFIKSISAAREKQLKEILTATQYAAYLKDLEAMSARLNKN